MAQPTPSRTPTLVVALTLANKPALMLGGGAEAAMKTQKLLDAGARVTLVSPTCTPALAALASAGRIAWFVREVQESDLRGQRVVVLSDKNATLAAWLHARRAQYGFLLATVDQPRTCDFYFTAKVDAGPIELSLSSGGSAPLLLRRLRELLTPAFDERFQRFAAGLVRLRESLADAPAGERRSRLAAALEGFAIDIRLRYPDKLEGPPGLGGHERSQG